MQKLESFLSNNGTLECHKLNKPDLAVINLLSSTLCLKAISLTTEAASSLPPMTG
jgi:hypothetical protein